MNFIIDNFNMLFDSEEGLKKLDEIILDLAVKGKLVSQDPTDEPASILIEKIEEEKKKLIAKKKIKKPKKLESISKEELPFDIPKNWEWVRLGDIIKVGDNLNIQKEFNPDEIINYVDIDAIDNNSFKIKNIKVKPVRVLSSRARRVLKKGYIFYSLVRPYLKNIAIIEENKEKFIGTTGAIVFKPIIGENKYIFNFLLCDYINNNYIKALKGFNSPSISQNYFLNTLLPLPPLEEQKRIVKRIDSLKKLIEDLRTQVKIREKTRHGLKKSIMVDIEKSSDDKHLLKNLELVFQNFNIIVKKKEDIKDIRNLVLSMAVKGKLVEQDPNAEPASILIEKIKEEKKKLIAEKKIKKPKELEPISEDEIPFDIPENWEWVRLREIVSLLGDGLHGTPNYSDNGEYFFINGNNLSDGKIEIKNNTKRVTLEEYNKYKKGLGIQTVFVSINGTLGNIAFYNNEKIMLGKSACYFNLLNLIEKNYIKLIINSKYFLNYAFKTASGTTIKNLSLRAMNNLKIPLPPLAEQKRIVKRVDKLMELCDKLEEQVLKSENEMGILTKAITKIK